MTKYQRYKIIIQIHKFTIKIDTISINLLFECVRIVEFNFNSHVFLVMYQDVRFLNKEERRQFLISSVSERDWKREHRLELLIVSIFQMQVKFSKVCSPFCSTAGTVSKKIPMGGTQNFLQDVKRNINALCVICGWHGRVTESAQENQLTQDLELLMQVMDSRLQSLAKLNSDFHYQGNTEESSQVWPDPPPATRYPPPATRHPSPAIRYPPPAEKSCRVRKCWKA